MVWYQKFEYAISHWLQKATEHVFGCVLCSPGCFSLFRGSALLADNVMKTYTRLPTEAAHYVQYDQGEFSKRRGRRFNNMFHFEDQTYASHVFNINKFQSIIPKFSLQEKIDGYVHCC